MTAPKLIIFDCDGTLADSQSTICDAMRQTFVTLGLAPPRRADILQTVGLSLPETFHYLAPSAGVGVQADLAAVYRETSAALKQRPGASEAMFKGAAQLLSALASRDGITLGIATGKSRRGLDRFLDRNGLSGLFATVQTADDAPSKPHPGMLMQAMHETGTDPAETVMIGDTSYDMIMAAHAQVASIGVSWGNHTLSELKRAGAGCLVRSFGELSRALIGDGEADEARIAAA